MIQAWDTVRDTAYSHELLLSILIELSDQVAILTRNLSSMLFHLMFIFCPKPGPFPSNVIVLESTYHPSYHHAAFLTKTVCGDVIHSTHVKCEIWFGFSWENKKMLIRGCFFTAQEILWSPQLFHLIVSFIKSVSDVSPETPEIKLLKQ